MKIYTVIVETDSETSLVSAVGENPTEAAQEVFALPEVVRVVYVFEGIVKPLKFETDVNLLPQ